MSGEGSLDGRINIHLGFDELQLRSPALAIAKPLEGRIDLFVAGPQGRPGICPLQLAEAERLHETLGSALALMRRPGHLPAVEIHCGEGTERTLYWGGKGAWRRRLIRRALYLAGGFIFAAGLVIVFILPALMTGGR